MQESAAGHLHFATSSYGHLRAGQRGLPGRVDTERDAVVGRHRRDGGFQFGQRSETGSTEIEFSGPLLAISICVVPSWIPIRFFAVMSLFFQFKSNCSLVRSYSRFL